MPLPMLGSSRAIARYGALLPSAVRHGYREGPCRRMGGFSGRSLVVSGKRIEWLLTKFSCYLKTESSHSALADAIVAFRGARCHRHLQERALRSGLRNLKILSKAQAWIVSGYHRSVQSRILLGRLPPTISDPNSHHHDERVCASSIENDGVKPTRRLRSKRLLVGEAGRGIPVPQILLAVGRGPHVALMRRHSRLTNTVCTSGQQARDSMYSSTRPFVLRIRLRQQKTGLRLHAQLKVYLDRWCGRQKWPLRRSTPPSLSLAGASNRNAQKVGACSHLADLRLTRHMAGYDPCSFAASSGFTWRGHRLDSAFDPTCACPFNQT
nr:hypothetical protein CFP56_52232 [Quercus suber]